MKSADDPKGRVASEIGRFDPTPFIEEEGAEREARDRAAATAAAGAAAEATAELIRFSREGGLTEHTAFDSETISGLAGALKAMIEVEAGHMTGSRDAEGLEVLGQLNHALYIFLDCWA